MMKTVTQTKVYLRPGDTLPRPDNARLVDAYLAWLPTVVGDEAVVAAIFETETETEGSADA